MSTLTEMTVATLRDKLASVRHDDIVQIQFHTDDEGNPKSTTLQARRHDGITQDLWVWVGFDSKEVA